jgi:AbrB family looped-hinge helix DNA binding protein
MMKRDRSTGQFPLAINSGQRAEMETVKVSPEFKMVIPKRIRAAVELKPGEELQFYVLDRSIRRQRPQQHPRSIKELRGIAKGMQWKDDYRDRSDRF